MFDIFSSAARISYDTTSGNQLPNVHALPRSICSLEEERRAEPGKERRGRAIPESPASQDVVRGTLCGSQERDDTLDAHRPGHRP